LNIAENEHEFPIRC